MEIDERYINFGTIRGGITIEIAEHSDVTEITLSAFEGEINPISWRLEGNIRLTEEDMLRLKGMLEPFVRIFDKKVSEAIGHFVAEKRNPRGE